MGRAVTHLRAWVVALVVCAIFAGPAHAAFPGLNGKIVFNGPGGLSTVNVDGSGLWQRGAPGVDSPTWSPDGTEIAYVRRSSGEIHVINADGSGDAIVFNAGEPFINGLSWSPSGDRLVFAKDGDLHIVSLAGTQPLETISGPGYDRDPSWSPDGSAIAFTSDLDIYAIEPDGQNVRQLTDAVSGDHSPNWSPEGTRIAFDRATMFGLQTEIYLMNADGSNQTRVTFNDDGENGFDSHDPAWSPDGTLIVIFGYRAVGDDRFSGLFVINPATHREQFIADGHMPDWQPAAPETGFYPRPKGASAVRMALVPAYAECAGGSADLTHGPPLEHPSCSSPDQISQTLTVGTPDANGNAAKSISYLPIRVFVGDPATTADEADVHTPLILTDVRNRSDLSDYAGEVKLELTIRITDRDNSPGTGPAATGTTEEIPFSMPVQCTPTADTSVGSFCELDATFDSVLPGAVKERQRAVWEVAQVKVYDGGADGLADTDPNTLFMTQGIFVP